MSDKSYILRPNRQKAVKRLKRAMDAANQTIGEDKIGKKLKTDLWHKKGYLLLPKFQNADLISVSEIPPKLYGDTTQALRRYHPSFF
jgi:hypothetical protein